MPAGWARWFEERFGDRPSFRIQNDKLVRQDPVLALFRVGPFTIEPDNCFGFGRRQYQIFGLLPH
jgi:hypothetical protein